MSEMRGFARFQGHRRIDVAGDEEPFAEFLSAPRYLLRVSA
jgi:hypothetical protein